MPTNTFRFETSDADDCHVVRVYGELDLATAADFKDSLVEMDARRIVVDLSALDFVDSSGITAILGARKQIIARGGTLVLRGASGIVRRILEITGLSTLLDDEL